MTLISIHCLINYLALHRCQLRALLILVGAIWMLDYFTINIKIQSIYSRVAQSFWAKCHSILFIIVLEQWWWNILGFAKKTVVYYEPTFKKHFRRGKVTKINADSKVVNLEDGTEIPYDILVIATGSFGSMKESSATGAEIIEKYSKIAEEVMLWRK